MRIVITQHFLCTGWAFDVAYFQGDWCVTVGGSRFYPNQWRLAEEGEVVERVNPDLVEVVK